MARMIPEESKSMIERGEDSEESGQSVYLQRLCICGLVKDQKIAYIYQVRGKPYDKASEGASKRTMSVHMT